MSHVSLNKNKLLWDSGDSKVAILMATYNGLPWIEEQINSIFNQTHVNWHLFISDDCSTDGTWEWLNHQFHVNNKVTLLPVKKSGGSALNFFRLIRDANWIDYDYVAFSDQDDIWFSSKLEKQINIIHQQNAVAISSDVLAFWTNKKEKIIKKSFPQKKYDFLFEAGGPGCTYILRKDFLIKVQKIIIHEQSLLIDIPLCDWLIYAFARINHLKWYISPEPTLRYRQHSVNEFGANIGFKQAIRRFKLIQAGWFRNTILNIIEILSRHVDQKNDFDQICAVIKENSLFNRIWLISHITQLRRNWRDGLFLCIVFIFNFW